MPDGAELNFDQLQSWAGMFIWINIGERRLAGIVDRMRSLMETMTQVRAIIVTPTGSRVDWGARFNDVMDTSARLRYKALVPATVGKNYRVHILRRR